MSAPPPAAPSWHELQDQKNWCVPACACIIGNAIGAPLVQKELAGRWSGSGRGFALAEIAGVVGGQHQVLDPDHPRQVGTVQAYLTDSGLLAVQVFAAIIDEVSQRMAPPPSSPHGRLCTAPHGQLHALVLVGSEERGFWYLDPYFEAASQPRLLERDDFVRAFQGEVVVPLTPVSQIAASSR